MGSFSINERDTSQRHGFPFLPTTAAMDMISIAFDKQSAYKPDTRKILSDNTVLKLSDGNCELYGQSWNKEVVDNE